MLSKTLWQFLVNSPDLLVTEAVLEYTFYSMLFSEMIFLMGRDLWLLDNLGFFGEKIGRYQLMLAWNPEATDFSSLRTEAEAPKSEL